MINVTAKHGKVVVELSTLGFAVGEPLTRSDAVKLIGELAYAILQSGDYFDPEAQDFLASVQRAIKNCAIS